MIIFTLMYSLPDLITRTELGPAENFQFSILFCTQDYKIESKPVGTTGHGPWLNQSRSKLWINVDVTRDLKVA